MNGSQYVSLYNFFHSALARSVRLLVFFFLLSLLYLGIQSGTKPNIPLGLLGFALMLEVFIHLKVGKYHPHLTVNDTQDPVASFTFSVLRPYTIHSAIPAYIGALLVYPEVVFILERAGIERKEVTYHDIAKEDINTYAHELVKTLKGKYITPMDIVVSYLLLSEPQTKLLFGRGLKKEELLHILYWARLEYPQSEIPKKVRVHFDGGGLGDSLVSGWTPETQKYTSDFTHTTLRSRPLLIGREKEFDMMTKTLAKSVNNNIMLVGDIGSGKENLVAALAYESFEGMLSGQLNNKQISELMVGPLIAGMADRGELETRIQSIIAELSHAGNIILYLPEFQNILGSTSYKIDLSGVILPYLKGGNIPIIGAMSAGNYKTYLENNPLKEVFEVITLSEPDPDTAKLMLFEKTGDIEKKYRVILSYSSIRGAVKLSKRFLQDSTLPGGAVDLLETVANEVSLSDRPYFDDSKKKIAYEDDVVKAIETKTHVAVSAPKGKEKEILLHMEDKLHERVIDQVEAISIISEAMRRLRTGMASTDKPVSFLFLGPTGVGKTETAKALADLYFGGESNIIRLDMSEYTDESGVKRLLGAAPGEGEERGELTDKIHDHPASLVLLDEFEKANPKILDLFLQVLEDGRLTDNKGKTVSFVNAIIIATSNAGSEFIREEIKKGAVPDKKFHQQLLEHLQQKRIYKPELLNRFDDVVTFKPLGQPEVKQITQLLLKNLEKRLADEDITVKFDEKILEKIAAEGFDEQFGARPIRRYIQDHVEDVLAQKKLTEEIQRGSIVTMTTDAQNNISVSIAKDA